jgi:hypothetical protein
MIKLWNDSMTDKVFDDNLLIDSYLNIKFNLAQKGLMLLNITLSTMGFNLMCRRQIGQVY